MLQVSAFGNDPFPPKFTSGEPKPRVAIGGQTRLAIAWSVSGVLPSYETTTCVPWAASWESVAPSPRLFGANLAAPTVLSSWPKIASSAAVSISPLSSYISAKLSRMIS